MSGEDLSTNPETKPTRTKWDSLADETFAGGEQQEKDEAREKIDLSTPEYTAKFGKAEIFAKKGIVNAEQLTEEGLASGAYADKDIRYDEASGGYVVNTYVMRENEDGSRVAELEDTRPVEAGMWVLTNPVQQEGDHPNNYCQKDATFQKRYEATDEPGVYRAKGMARIIKNDTGHEVVIDDPWGTQQEGDKDCYFCVPYDPDHPFDIPEGKAYILSENDFANYGPAAEVRNDYVPIEDYVSVVELDHGKYSIDATADILYYQYGKNDVALKKEDEFVVHDVYSYYDGYRSTKTTIPAEEISKHVRGMTIEEFSSMYEQVPDNGYHLYRRKPGAPTLAELNTQP